MSEIERKLASIRTIKEITPISGADFIELIKIDGWQCVSKKGQFQIGDKCIYFEIDSFLPETEEYEFLRKSCFKNHEILGPGFRIKTIRLKNNLSQGLVLPIPDEYKSLPIGTDLTESLNIKKYIPPYTFDEGEVKGVFPGFISKTDEIRIQNFNNEELEEIFNLGKNWIITEKLEGTSVTVFITKDEYGVCGRTLQLNENGEGTIVKFMKTNNMEDKLKTLKKHLAFQGEFIGPKIQKNYYNLKDFEFRVFNIFNIDDHNYLDWDDVVSICKDLDIKTVPEVCRMIISSEFQDYNSLLKLAEGKSILNSDREREGIVIKLPNNYKSFKVINNKYLLNEK